MKPVQYAYAQRILNEESRLTFEVLSDIHTRLPFRSQQLDKTLDDIWSRKTKTLLILGDFTNNGYMLQWRAFLRQLKEYPFRYLMSLGNHDTYHLLETSQIHIHPLYKELILQEHHALYYDTYIQGVHFYILNSEKPSKSNAFYSKRQLTWLKEGLNKDSKDKPVFVLGHQPFYHSHTNTDDVALTMGVQEEDLKNILKKHDHVIFMSGHVHNSYELCDIVFDESLTLMNIPSYIKPDFGSQRAMIGFQLQIYHDFLYLRTRDYKDGSWIISHEFIIDFKKHQCYPFDGDWVQAPR